MRPLILTLLVLATGCASNGIEKARKQRREEIQAIHKSIREREIEAYKANQKAVKKYQAESPEILKKGLKIK
jgi:hypothetical protein